MMMKILKEVSIIFKKYFVSFDNDILIHVVNLHRG
jgi:hypothetical protein